MRSTYTVCIVVLFLTMLCMAVSGAEYFAAPDGDDLAAGSRKAPWKTLQKVSEAARPGDTVTFLPGRYPGTLAPHNSGTEQDPITFRAEPRLEAQLLADGPETYGVNLNGVSHIRIQGFAFRPEPDNGRWMFMNDCSHITVEDCRMEDSTGGMPVRFERSDQVQVRGCVVRRAIGHNMFRIGHCTHVLLEGNSISRTGHSPLQLYPDNSNRNVAIRGNVFHCAWGRNFEHFGTHDCLFEHNIVTNAYNGGHSASATAKFATTRGIFRFNRVFRNYHSPMHLYPFRDVWVKSLRLYNNVFDHNGGYGIAAAASRDQVQDCLFVNNIFSRNDPRGVNRQLRMNGGKPTQMRVVNNIITTGQAGEAVIHDYDEQRTVSQMQSRYERYRDNKDMSPGYVNADQYNHALIEDSPLRDAGRFLTHAVGAGEGDLLPVVDATGFYDGYGIDGEQGDMIAVGRGGQKARVVDVDHAADMLHLDREIEWEDGDPVDLPWSGGAPDIGVYEHGSDGRPSVQVIVEPFESRPGDEVSIRAVMHGDLQPEKIEWMLGDGSHAEGTAVTHRYDGEYDYAIRARVIDTEGDIHWSGGYAVVSEPVDPSEPLIHTTWDADDDRAWWLWKSYRPFPAAFEDIVDEDTKEGYRHVYAPEDKGRLPAQIHPRGWDIDRYPQVFIRYRISEDTPIAIELHTWTYDAAVIAASPAADVDEDRRVGDYVLEDDGQWHEVSIDSRVIRDRFAGLEMLRAMRIGAAPRGDVDKGDWYDLDEVTIGPATGAQ